MELGQLVCDRLKCDVCANLPKICFVGPIVLAHEKACKILVPCLSINLAVKVNLVLCLEKEQFHNV